MGNGYDSFLYCRDIFSFAFKIQICKVLPEVILLGNKKLKKILLLVFTQQKTGMSLLTDFFL